MRLQRSVMRLAVWAGLLVSGCSEAPSQQVGASANDARAWADVLKSPTDYHGRVLRLNGWCRIEPEGSALYASETALENRDAARAVALPLGWPVPEDLRALDARPVLVEGTFSASSKGNLAAFRGAFVTISRIEPLPPR